MLLLQYILYDMMNNDIKKMTKRKQKQNIINNVIFKQYIEAAIPGLKHPAPFRTWQLSSRGLHQYWARWLPGNVQCRFLFRFLFPFLLYYFFTLLLYLIFNSFLIHFYIFIVLNNTKQLLKAHFQKIFILFINLKRFKYYWKDLIFKEIHKAMCKSWWILWGS